MVQYCHQCGNKLSWWFERKFGLDWFCSKECVEKYEREVYKKELERIKQHIKEYNEEKELFFSMLIGRTISNPAHRQNALPHHSVITEYWRVIPAPSSSTPARHWCEALLRDPATSWPACAYAYPQTGAAPPVAW